MTFGVFYMVSNLYISLFDKSSLKEYGGRLLVRFLKRVKGRERSLLALTHDAFALSVPILQSSSVESKYNLLHVVH
jgi:hypothetical protein